ncbi:4'-phosphopantetheinyl transferase family protein [Lacisediminihabitans changchengi]|uniref:4'-phosphopantetheinyl transferase superfamily protein n=1 Tax=Lacisediminihabitans changchengi TaxID=2787634 RepID=A0A934VZC2_9MICO|nr:4'-phosphopantetheinyl transferase superfamily protein [Lacisediminihabitans changchengi]MBK4348992.1 4'-phosphopantetheinyl transferase superfamily protein [Lacisediminihabitans changchengi]
MGDFLNHAVDVWLVRLPAHPLTAAATDDLLSLVDADTRQRVLRYHQPERDRTLAAHAGLRRLLAPRLAVPPAAITLERSCAACGSTEHGKPSLAGVHGIEFSLSHSGELVAIAIAGMPVGVDVQLRSPETDWASIRSDVFTHDEWSDDPIALNDLWARKEAVAKTTGLGMSARFSEIHPASTGVRSWAAGRIAGRDLGSTTHSAAVAILGGSPVVTQHALALSAITHTVEAEAVPSDS